jgi:hypothetical protein
MPLPQPVLEILRDATSPRKRPWLLVLFGLFLLCAAWKMQLGTPQPPRSPPDTIDYHYTQWLRQVDALHRDRPTNRVSINSLEWFLDGKPSTHDRYEQIEEHETALIRLGYFEEFRFDTKGAAPMPILLQFYTNAMRTDLKYYWTASTVYHPQTNICITARKQNIPAIAAIFKHLDNARTNH